jgi:hypothetical protein
MKMEAEDFSEYRTTRLHIPEDISLYIYRYGNSIYHMLYTTKRESRPIDVNLSYLESFDGWENVKVSFV